MSYELIALDLDGTLTNSKKEITPATREALIEIQKAGKKVVLASARPECGVTPLAKELEMDKYGGYLLCFNGGKIRQCASGELFSNVTLDPEMIKPVYDIVKQYPDIDILAHRDHDYLSGHCVNDYTVLEGEINHMTFEHVDNFVEAIDFPLNKLFIAGPGEKVEPAMLHLQKEFDGVLGVYCAEPYFLNVMPLGIDKANSLLNLLESLGLTADQMICCGDGYNDISMIQAAGLGVAMDNAPDVVKEAADFITLSNDEDGVLHVINKFMRD